MAFPIWQVPDSHRRPCASRPLECHSLLPLDRRCRLCLFLHPHSLVGFSVRSLEHAVQRFGAGDLSARADARRKDEFGKLARSFNLMAERIETLLTAERRLLQDVSHELRSPLARLEFAVELARTSADRDKALDRIKKETNRLRHSRFRTAASHPRRKRSAKP